MQGGTRGSLRALTGRGVVPPQRLAGPSLCLRGRPGPRATQLPAPSAPRGQSGTGYSPLSQPCGVGRTVRTRGLQGSGATGSGHTRRTHLQTNTDAPWSCPEPLLTAAALSLGSQPLGGVPALWASTPADSGSQPPDADTRQPLRAAPQAPGLSPRQRLGSHGPSTQNTISRTVAWPTPASRADLGSESPPRPCWTKRQTATDPHFSQALDVVCSLS